MEITFYGVRGTIPVPGTNTNEYGGNTPCVHVRTKNGYDLVLDAGTGICNLARKLMGTPLGKGQGEISILLSHTHWDHIQGFPFFIPVFIPGNKINVFGRHNTETELKSLLEGQLYSPYSPIFALSNLSATLRVEEVGDDPLALDGVTVRSQYVPHAKLQSVAYRIEEDGKALVYMTDLEHKFGDLDEPAVQLAQGANILVHDTHYSPEDYEKARGRGHSSMEMAVQLARKAGVKQLVMFHYSPDYDDARVRALYERFKDQAGFTVIAAQEGLRLVL